MIFAPLSMSSPALSAKARLEVSLFTVNICNVVIAVLTLLFRYDF